MISKALIQRMQLVVVLELRLVSFALDGFDRHFTIQVTGCKYLEV